MRFVPFRWNLVTIISPHVIKLVSLIYPQRSRKSKNRMLVEKKKEEKKGAARKGKTAGEKTRRDVGTKEREKEQTKTRGKN